MPSESDLSRSVPADNSPFVPGIAGLLTVIVAAIVLVALSLGREVFLPIVLAVLLAFVLAPIVEFLRRWHFGRVTAVITTVVVTLSIVATLAGVIGTQLAGLTTEIPRYEATIQQKVSSLRGAWLQRLPDLFTSIGRRIDEATKEEEAPSGATLPSQTQRPIPVEVREPTRTSLAIVGAVLSPLIKPLATTGLVFIVLVFILLQRQDLRDRMIRLFGVKDIHRTTVAMDDAAFRLSRYFLLQLGMNTLFGVFVAAALWAIGLPSPVLWGILAAIMRFVPYIGSLIAGSLPVLLAAAVDPGWSMALTTVALFLIAEPLMGHVIEPLVYGKGTGLSPFAVVIAAIVWTWLWGPVGLIIATPITLCLVILGRHVERLTFLDVLLGDEPALTPTENLYQRMLAGDPDEALELAEQLLKDRSLVSYYDEVALPALRIAAADARRGILEGMRLKRVKEAMLAVVADLGGHSEPEPAQAEEGDPSLESVPQKSPTDVWRLPGTILCLAGSDLDEPAAAMLVQLLGKNGLSAYYLPHESVSRSNISALDLNDVAMLCVVDVDLQSVPARLRYLVRRLRRKAEDTPMLIGFWHGDDPIPHKLNDKSAAGSQSLLRGADFAVSSLADAVECCLGMVKGIAQDAPTVRNEVAPTKPAVDAVPLPA